MKNILPIITFDFPKAHSLANEQHYAAFEKAIVGSARATEAFLGTGHYLVVGSKPTDPAVITKLGAMLVHTGRVDERFAHAMYWSESDEVTLEFATAEGKWIVTICSDPIYFSAKPI